MKIRVMHKEDYERIYDLWIHTPGMGLNNVDDSREGIGKFLKRNPSTCFVAENDGEIIGVILCGHDGRRGFIYHTTVKLAYRKQGIGKKLVEAAMNALEEEGIQKTALVVFSHNDTRNVFWEKLGFTSREDLTYRNKLIHQLERIDT